MNTDLCISKSKNRFSFYATTHQTTFLGYLLKKKKNQQNKSEEGREGLLLLSYLKQLVRNRSQNVHGEAPVLVLFEVVIQRQAEALKDEAAVPLVLQLREHLHAEGGLVRLSSDASLPLVHVAQDLRFYQCRLVVLFHLAHPGQHQGFDWIAMEM